MNKLKYDDKVKLNQEVYNIAPKTDEEISLSKGENIIIQYTQDYRTHTYVFKHKDYYFEVNLTRFGNIERVGFLGSSLNTYYQKPNRRRKSWHEKNLTKRCY